ncbi:MAG: M81 family metallopeptidase [Pseudomonadota bacterium]
MMRIAVAGFQHETNTFATNPTRLADFEVADSWPGLLEDRAVITETLGLNLPIAGFCAAARDAGVDVVPLLWCAAEPSGRVDDTTFEAITARILTKLRAAGPLDALYLDLHGAMVTESEDDGEGALLRALRARFGTALPIGISLDLHANISAATAQLVEAITVYRTYPHLDMAETGARCLPLLLAAIDAQRQGLPRPIVIRHAPFLLPLPAQDTSAEPLASLYAQVAAVAGEPGCHAELALGFTAADTAHTGPAVVAQAPDLARATALADEINASLIAAAPSFDTSLFDPEAAVAKALAVTAPEPVIIADVQDNPGAGASSDTTGLLKALVAAEAENAILGLLDDPEIAARAHAAGPGAVIDAALGGRASIAGDSPFTGRFQVETLGDGHCAYTGAMYGGGTAILGPVAVLRVLGAGSVRVVVGSRRSQCLDRAIFTHVGLDPSAAKIVVVKSTLHYRADFAPGAAAVISCAAPGGFPCRLDTLPYRRLRPGLRLGPEADAPVAGEALHEAAPP